MKPYKQLLWILFLCMLFPKLAFAETPDFNQLVEALFEKNNQITSLQMELIMKERIRGEYIDSKNYIKVNYSPLKVFVKQEYPRNGLEILYNEQINKEKCMVYTNTFPWTTIAINPLSSMVRKEGHHSIFKSGYGYIVNVLEHAYNTYRKQINSMVIYQGLVKYDGTLCYKYHITMPDFKFVPYTVQKDETLEFLSYKLKVNDFMIYERNKSIRNIQDIHEGETIMVPNVYGSEIVLYICKDNGLLAGVRVFDDIGLYEEFTYRNVVVNPNFSELTFSPENPEYKIRD